MFFILYISGVIVTMLKMSSLNTNKDRAIFILFYLVIMLVYALPYQASSLGILVGLYLLKFNKRNEIGGRYL